MTIKSVGFLIVSRMTPWTHNDFPTSLRAMDNTSLQDRVVGVILGGMGVGDGEILVGVGVITR